MEIYEEAVFSCLEESVSIELNDQSKEQARLSLKYGGLGLRSLRTHAAAAYISSVAAANAHADIDISIADYNSHVADADQLTQDSARSANRKHSLSSAIEENSFRLLLEHVSLPSEKVRLMETSALHASDWMTCVPSPALGLRLEAEEVQTLVKLKLGFSVSALGEARSSSQDTTYCETQRSTAHAWGC